MLTLPSTVAKASPLSFTLNKVAVLAGATDSYWMNSANIKSVIVVYRSTAGNQRKRLEFDFTQATPTATATWTGTARSDHDIEQIVLVDFDGDTYSIPSANLPSGKGVSFGGGAPVITISPPIMGVHGAGVFYKASAGKYIAFGRNAEAQFGRGDTNASTAPVLVSNSYDFASIYGGLGLTGQCSMAALDSSGIAYTWGYNTNGQGGRGTTGGTLSIGPVSGGRSYSTISIGHTGNGSTAWGGYVLAIEAATNDIYCWGYGCGTSPTKATGTLNASKVSAGVNALGIAVSTGYVYQWSGLNAPTLILSDQEYSDIAGTQNGNVTSNRALFAIAKTTGTLYSWGISGSNNTNGILGNGTTNFSTTPTAVSGSRAYSKVSAGYSHAAAIEKTTGKLYTWGLNSTGQLGDGTVTSRYEPTLVASDKSFSDVYCGDAFTVAVESGTGKIYTWGNGSDGRLGNSSTSNSSTAVYPKAFASLVANYTAATIYTPSVDIYGINRNGDSASITDGTNTASVTFANSSLPFQVPSGWNWSTTGTKRLGLTSGTDTFTIAYIATPSTYLKFEGGNGSKTLIDSSGNSLVPTTLNANAAISTAQAKFGTGSCYLDGAASYLSYPSNAALAAGTSDFTYELWYYPTAWSSTQNTLIDTLNTGGAGARSTAFSLAMTSSAIKLWHNGSFRINVTVTNTLNQWVHIAVCRVNGTTTVYKNGTSVGSTTAVGNLSSSYLVIGQSSDGPTGTVATARGYIDELIVWNGLGLYTANFTPRTSAWGTG